MNIYVCVGSSCHLKGSYKIINLMKENIAKNSLEDKVNLSAAFCLGKCTNGVSIKIDDEIICGVSAENFMEIFNKHVIGSLER
jgi:NADH:ubiquinone oxidoreductase subunit E